MNSAIESWKSVTYVRRLRAYRSGSCCNRLSLSERTKQHVLIPPRRTFSTGSKNRLPPAALNNRNGSMMGPMRPQISDSHMLAQGGPAHPERPLYESE